MNGYNKQNGASKPQGFAKPTLNLPKNENKGAEKYGLERFEKGTRVTHSVFGAGVILSTKDMGADILYEVKFDTGVTKKLMATFAKLKKI